MSTDPSSDQAAQPSGEEAPAPNEQDSRRVFMKVLGVGGLGACAAAISAIPALAAFSYPLGHETTSSGGNFLVAGKLSRFKPGEPVLVDLFADRVDAWSRMVNVKVGSVWVINDGDNKLRAMSAICPHLGCLVDYEKAEKKFLCPCHTSWFHEDGSLESGPSPRGMDDLEVEVKGNEVSIRYQRFKLGSKQKEPA